MLKSKIFSNHILSRSLILLLTGFVLLSGCADEGGQIAHLDLDAHSAMIVDIKTGRVLYEKDPDKRLPPASTTKLLTAVVALENLPLNSMIEVSRNAANVTPTVAPLGKGAKYSLAELLAGILIRSANDAAVAIAGGVAGSEEEFAVLMNETAEKIGMTDSYFERASGLPTGTKDRQYTTSRDLVRLMRYALKFDIIPQLLSRSEATIKSSEGVRLRLTTNNRALLTDSDAPWGKTGYTKEARRTFVAINGSTEPQIAFALLKSSDLWEDMRKLNRAGLSFYE